MKIFHLLVVLSCSLIFSSCKQTARESLHLKNSDNHAQEDTRELNEFLIGFKPNIYIEINVMLDGNLSAANSLGNREATNFYFETNREFLESLTENDRNIDGFIIIGNSQESIHTLGKTSVDCVPIRNGFVMLQNGGIRVERTKFSSHVHQYFERQSFD